MWSHLFTTGIQKQVTWDEIQIARPDNAFYRLFHKTTNGTESIETRAYSIKITFKTCDTISVQTNHDFGNRQ